MGEMRLAGRTAVVTGAGSGIGRALAGVLAARGCHLALVDRDAEGLEATAAPLRGGSRRVTTYLLDVSDGDAVAALPAAVRAAHGGADLLFNNAGVGVGGTFEQVSAEDFDWLLAINFHAVVRLTRAFLPLLKASDDARLVNISSVFGLTAPAGQAAYAAAKFAVRGFTEALRHEYEGTALGVTVVHPGGVATRIADRARVSAGVDPAEAERRRAEANRHLRMPPTRAAEIIVRGVERRRGRVLVGVDALALSWLVRLLPERYWTVLKRRVAY